MSKRYTALLLADMLEAINEMQQFTEGLTYETFILDTKTFKAVFANALILGEAAKNLPEDLQEEASSIPWHKLRGLRNRLAHAYFDVDSKTLWLVATKDAPTLITTLQELLLRYPLPLEEDPLS